MVNNLTLGGQILIYPPMILENALSLKICVLVVSVHFGHNSLLLLHLLLFLLMAL
jgi:hypothetical protein